MTTILAPPPQTKLDDGRTSDHDDYCHIASSPFISYCGLMFAEGITCEGDLMQEGDICSCCGRPFCQECLVAWKLTHG